MEKLPKQLLLYLLNFLHIKDAYQISRTCKKLRDAFEHENFWKMKCEQQFGSMGMKSKLDDISWKKFFRFDWKFDTSQQKPEEFNIEGRSIEWKGHTHSTFRSSIVFRKGLCYHFLIKMDNINSIRVGAGYESFNYFVGDTGYAIGNNHNQFGTDVSAFGVPIFGSLYDYALHHTAVSKPAKYTSGDMVTFTIDLINFQFMMKKNDESTITILNGMNKEKNWVFFSIFSTNLIYYFLIIIFFHLRLL
eukprot:TRINITY_DN13213_c0_g1_i1.p1 TRINITY_DN13213_c0_g1~~TRINITY_DN13213_c0_g1_i1.p1  ORF type:complete len:257 (+),score=31.19 TRINITY_DN13213_c0_g1_i1:31-771(+)